MKITSPFLLAALAVTGVMAGGHHAAAQSTRSGTHVDVLPSIGLTLGETLRVSFVNTSADPLTIMPCVHDPDGVIVKQETVTLRGGQTGWMDISRSEVSGRGDRRLQLRAGVILTKVADARDLMAGGEIIDELTGKTNAYVPPSLIFGGWSNHNETLIVDDERE